MAAKSKGKPAKKQVAPAKRAAAKSKPVAVKKTAAKAESKASTAKSEVERQLRRYRSMRDFGVTAEPAGGGAKNKKSELPFVIQKHAATRLHYDFRLGWRGVLKSWAVTKGPSYVTADKRLAVEVEDHPIEYGGFEGTIPKGQYGGGTVMLWDEGTWAPQPGVDVDASLKSGQLKFILHGQKLQGKWALIRMGARPGDTKPNWLLIKEHDEFERSANAPAITEEMPDSVLTGRDMDAIAQASDHVWQSKESANSPPEKLPLAERLRQKLQAKAAKA
jgi:bifunctional non-homologous end joining protein LigD